MIPKTAKITITEEERAFLNKYAINPTYLFRRALIEEMNTISYRQTLLNNLTEKIVAVKAKKIRRDETGIQ